MSKEITFEKLLEVINDNPSEYEERYIRWVSVAYDKKKLSELLYELKYLKEENKWPERILLLEEILEDVGYEHCYNLLVNESQTARFAMIEKYARQAALEILIFDRYSIDTLNTLSQFPLADYQLATKRVYEIVSMIRDITTSTSSLAHGLAGQ
jgi:hypothetical protein